MKDSRVYLEHIRDEIAFIRSVSSTLSLDELTTNKEKEHAITRSLEIIGEASKNVPENIRNAHPEIPWTFMAGLRDGIISGATET